MNKLSLFIILSLLTASMALYDAKSKVIKLTSGNFRDQVINSKELWFVEFYGNHKRPFFSLHKPPGVVIAKDLPLNGINSQKPLKELLRSEVSIWTPIE
jgi:hypothetical protein